jgi:hypothetical protein
MTNKKKKIGSHKSQLKQQKLLADSQLVNDCTVPALKAPSLSHTVHVTVPVPSNLNSNQSPPVVLAPESSCPNHHVISALRGSLPQNHGDPSASINHVFVENYSDNDDLDDEEVDFDSSGEDYVGGSKFFTSSVFEAPSVPVAPPAGA